jgi:outer membrane receptor for Fe3+-dicitrate
MAIEEQVRAYGGPRFQLTQQVMNRFAEAIEQSRVDVVPKVVIGTENGHGGEAGFGGSNVLQALFALMLSDRLGIDVAPPSAPRPEAEQIRSELRGRLKSEGPPKP